MRTPPAGRTRDRSHMVGIVFKPVRGAPVVSGEGLYDAVFNQRERMFRIRARTAGDAERKLMIMFRAQAKGRTFSFRTEDFTEYDDGNYVLEEPEDRGGQEGGDRP